MTPQSRAIISAKLHTALRDMDSCRYSRAYMRVREALDHLEHLPVAPPEQSGSETGVEG